MSGKPIITMDLRSALLPVALLEVTRVMKTLSQDQVVEIVVGDPEVKADLRRLASAYSMKMEELEELKGDDGCARLRFRR
jgi:TusA-related sulfurtransferase